MSRLPESSSHKRKRQDLTLVSRSLTDAERVLYDIIHSKKDLGIWIADLRREANLADSIVKKSLKLLQTKNLIKEVVNIQNRGRKHYMATEFEPSKVITGGNWYTDGKLDTDFINDAKEVCLKYIFKQKVTTLDGVLEWIKKNPVFNVDVSAQQIEEIFQTLILDDEIIEVKNTGSEEFASVPLGKIGYKCKSKGGVRGEKKPGAMASIPCGVCPRINSCTPDGNISPITCHYYEKWLEF